MSSEVNTGVEGISRAGDQSWSERSLYRTLKTASVCTKLSCSLKAASLAVSLAWCASATPFNSHRLGHKLARGPAPVPLAMPEWW